MSSTLVKRMSACRGWFRADFTSAAPRPNAMACWVAITVARPIAKLSLRRTCIGCIPYYFPGSFNVDTPCAHAKRAESDTQPAFTERFRSEEHTSELQSRGHLVCRLLLEKKKKNT